ncbi:MAG: hypothetical protein OXC63_03300 [Aestuariivita sp.]|nr:hypothetical protein [Aestuariivita sp.]MCY4346089.1 hypothetical protein [Aestuariivita sp.]
MTAHLTDGTLKTAISDKGDEASIDLLMDAAPYFKLTAGKALEVMVITAKIVNGWKKIADQIGMSTADQKAYSSAFEL